MLHEGMGYDERDRYINHIKAMDDVFLEHAAKKMKEAMEEAKRKP